MGSGRIMKREAKSGRNEAPFTAGQESLTWPGLARLSSVPGPSSHAARPRVVHKERSHKKSFHLSERFAGSIARKAWCKPNQRRCLWCVSGFRGPWGHRYCSYSLFLWSLLLLSYFFFFVVIRAMPGLDGLNGMICMMEWDMHCSAFSPQFSKSHLNREQKIKRRTSTPRQPATKNFCNASGGPTASEVSFLVLERAVFLFSISQFCPAWRTDQATTSLLSLFDC